MNIWKSAALVAALVGAAGAGAALSPVHGQGASRSRALEMIGGRGSQLGVSIRDVDTADAKTGTTGGVVIEEVADDTPARKAGLQKGDVIVEYDGERVRSARQFARLVQESVPGRQVQAGVLRDGRRMTVTIEPRESDLFRLFGDADGLRVYGMAPRARPAIPAPPAVPPVPAVPDFEAFIWRGMSGLGITTIELSEQLGEYFGATDGVLVTSVTEDSVAAKAGLKAGDVVTSFNGAAIDSASDLRRGIQRLREGDEFTMEILRDRKATTLKGTMEDGRERRRTFRTVL